MILAKFEELLRQSIGLDAASIGSSTIARAVRARASACGVDTRAYWELVTGSASELQALVESIVVAETWFFRDCEAFAAIAHIAHKDWLPTHSQGVLRLLSLPCSSGEEPYSMAMALLDSAFPANRYCIDAIDISAQALTHARRAVYGKNSFRGVELGFRNRHFEATQQGYRVRDAVRDSVRFHHGNLLAADFLPGAEIYDMIFCRNLLIYFDRRTQVRAIRVLRRLLTANGMLFVGPSEAGLLLSHDFVSVKMPLAFAFRKVDAVECTTLARPKEETLAQRRIAPSIVNPSAPGPVTPIVARRACDASLDPATNLATGIEQATLLADQGQLVEAAKCCEEHLRAHGPSAEAFHLLGLIRAAAGNLVESAEYYRKTIYLDPNHTQSLVHLALLLEKQGDNAGAKVLSDRVRRLDGRKGKQHGR